MPTCFSHIRLYVTDLKRAMLWYQRVLEFESVYVAEPHYARLRSTPMDLTIALHLAHDRAPTLEKARCPISKPTNSTQRSSG